MREASRREIGRFDGRRAALNSEDEVATRQATRLGPVCCGFVGCDKEGGRLAQAAGSPCFVVVLRPASSLTIKPQHTGPTRVACLAVHLVLIATRRPSNRPIARRDAS